jgi:hypothetical protein
MKHIKGILLIFSILAIFFTLLSLLIPSKILSTQGVTIAKDSSLIFNCISQPDSIAAWHPIFKTAKASTTGNKLSWAIEKNNYAFIIDSAKYPVVHFSFTSNAEPKAENVLSVSNTQIPNQYQVLWQTVYHVPWYPWEKFAAIFLEKEISSANEQALLSLKKRLSQ